MIMHEHILIYDTHAGKGMDIDILDNKIIIDKITADDF